MKNCNPIKFVKGKRVYLRPVEREDLDFIYAAFWCEEGRRLTGTQTVYNRNSIQNWFETISTDNSRIDLIICLEENNKPIGDITMMEIDHQNQNAIVRISIFKKENWGKGYGTEAMSIFLDYGFNILNLHRVELEVFAFNPRAKKSYEKLGFKQEGLIRDKLFYDGQFHDAILMGVLREEFNRVT